jgi:hypothetical protein
MSARPSALIMSARPSALIMSASTRLADDTPKQRR